MNNRGLSLSQTEMLKGYLLANIEDPDRRTVANSQWRERIQKLNGVNKETEADFFKNWLRSQYATKIRERKRGATPEDFDRIGSAYHRWVRDARASIGLADSDDYFSFIARDFDFYSSQSWSS